MCNDQQHANILNLTNQVSASKYIESAIEAHPEYNKHLDFLQFIK